MRIIALIFEDFVSAKSGSNRIEAWEGRQPFAPNAGFLWVYLEFPVPAEPGM